MELWNLCGVAILSALCCVIVKECGGKLSMFIAIIGGLFLLFFAFRAFSHTFSFLNELQIDSSISPYIMTILKILSVGYCVALSADMCRDMGESGIAAKLEILGKAEILLLCLPKIKEIIELAISIS